MVKVTVLESIAWRICAATAVGCKADCFEVGARDHGPSDAESVSYFQSMRPRSGSRPTWSSIIAFDVRD